MAIKKFKNALWCLGEIRQSLPSIPGNPSSLHLDLS